MSGFQDARRTLEEEVFPISDPAEFSKATSRCLIRTIRAHPRLAQRQLMVLGASESGLAMEYLMNGCYDPQDYALLLETVMAIYGINRNCVSKRAIQYAIIRTLPVVLITFLIDKFPQGSELAVYFVRAWSHIPGEPDDHMGCSICRVNKGRREKMYTPEEGVRILKKLIEKYPETMQTDCFSVLSVALEEPEIDTTLVLPLLAQESMKRTRSFGNYWARYGVLTAEKATALAMGFDGITELHTRRDEYEYAPEYLSPFLLGVESKASATLRKLTVMIPGLDDCVHRGLADALVKCVRLEELNLEFADRWIVNGRHVFVDTWTKDSRSKMDLLLNAIVTSLCCNRSRTLQSVEFNNFCIIESRPLEVLCSSNSLQKLHFVDTTFQGYCWQSMRTLKELKITRCAIGDLRHNFIEDLFHTVSYNSPCLESLSVEIEGELRDLTDQILLLLNNHRTLQQFDSSFFVHAPAIVNALRGNRNLGKFWSRSQNAEDEEKETMDLLVNMLKSGRNTVLYDFSCLGSLFGPKYQGGHGTRRNRIAAFLLDFNRFGRSKVADHRATIEEFVELLANLTSEMAKPPPNPRGWLGNHLVSYRFGKPDTTMLRDSLYYAFMRENPDLWIRHITPFTPRTKGRPPVRRKRQGECVDCMRPDSPINVFPR